MADRPIIFSAPMVRALLAGRKTQTRRVLKTQPDTTGDPSGSGEWGAVNRYGYWRPAAEVRPYQVGDQLWAREALDLGDITRPIGHATYAADGADVDLRHSGAAVWAGEYKRRFVPSIHMPRWASRLTLTVTDVRVQRLQDISNEDAIAEGIEPHGHAFSGYGKHADVWMAPYDSFASLWNSIHGPKPRKRAGGTLPPRKVGVETWDQNPWVCALTFEVHHCNIDNMEANHG